MVALVVLKWVGIVALILMALYMLMIMPRMIHKPDRKPHVGVLYAHRGLFNNDSDAPENSLKAFKKAVEMGFGIEMDVQLTKDRIPVVFHDFTLSRMCGVEGKVADYTYEELQAHKLLKSQETIPTFEEVLKLVNGKVPLIVELKIEWTDFSVCPIANKLLKEYQGVYCIESFNPLALLWYRMYDNDVMRGQLADNFVGNGEYKGLLYLVLQNLLLNFATKPDFVAYNHQYHKSLSRRICRDFYHNVGAAWTIKSQKELSERANDFDIFIFDSFVPNNENKKQARERAKQCEK